MAIDAATIWEFRPTTGAPENGGGFANLDPGTSVDYSDQAAAELVETDGATSGIGVTTFTSANGGFTAAMVGNVLQIAAAGPGSNYNAGWYQITAHTDTNTVTLDQAPDDGVGGVSGAIFQVGGALDDLTADFFNNANAPGPVAGNTIYVKKDGVMTLTGAIDTGLDGTLLLPITIEGYDASRGDNPTGTDRPTIAAGANAFTFDDSWRIRNLIVNTTAASGLRTDTGSVVENCTAVNSSPTANRNAITIQHYTRIVSCEASSLKGYAATIAEDCRVLASYFFDSSKGLNIPASKSWVVSGCVFDSVGVGCNPSAGADYWTVANNVYINCTKALEVAATCDNAAIVNNIFKENFSAIEWGDADASQYRDYNIYDGNTTDLTGIAGKGPNEITDTSGMSISVATGTDGTTEAGDETDFRSASAPFAGVTTDDVLVIHDGTGVVTGIYSIASVVSTSQLTISAGATTSASSCTFGVVKGEDFTLAGGANALDAGLQIGTGQGVTGDYKWNIGADQDDVAAGGGGTKLAGFGGGIIG